MSSKVHCYLRSLRLRWGLTQEELATLLPRASRNRVSRVERGLAPPNAGEILAYPLIFGVRPHVIFRRLSERTDEATMQHAYRLHQKLESKADPKAARKRELLDQLRDRAIKNAQQREI